MGMKTALKLQNYLLIMNKLLVCIVLILGFSVKGFSQLNFGIMSSNNYVGVYSYNGVTSTNAYVLRFQYSGTNLNIPYWKTSVRLLQPIISTDGTKQFPANKLAFQITNTTGQAQAPNTIPTVSQIGAPLSVSLQQGQETFLVPQSNAALKNTTPYNSYYDFQMNYNLIIEGGNYLTALQGGYTQKTYIVSLEFKAYGTNNEVLGVEQRNYTIDVFKLNNVPVENKLSIQIRSGSNALLDVKTLSDYVNGVSVIYPQGLSIIADADYQLHVKSIQANFISNTGNTLPLNTVRLDLIPASGNNANVFPVWLSAGSQKIATGLQSKGSPVYYDIRYATKPNDVTLIESKMEEYSTTLQYEITPQ